ncbi:MAG: hypothetical protein CMA64_11095 [Euryarchaeota archaeon]|nr:hypothetical protein [Euryarchaeota archaeon]
MLHPFNEDCTKLSTAQLYEKVADLTKKYFQTNNPQVKNQIQTFIDYYTQEAQRKEEKDRQEQQDIGELDLDKLININ